MLDRLMHGCWLRGIRLSASAGRLMISASLPQALSETLERELQARSNEILEWLESHPDYFEPRPLTDNEQALWFLQRMEPDNCAYNIAYAGRIKAEYCSADLPQRLEQAWQAVQQRYPLLSSAFAERDGELLQWDNHAQPRSLQCIDLEAADEAGLQQRLVELADMPFDLQAGEVSRLLLLNNQLEARVEQSLLLVIHHIAADLATFYIVFNELFALLNGEALAPVDPAAYRTWCSELHIRSEASEPEELAWWQTQLADAPALELPTDFPYGSSQGFVGGELAVRFDADSSARLRVLARNLGVTPYVLWFSLFQQFLGVISGQNDFVLGTPSGWRLKRGQAGLPGYLVNPLPIRCRLRQELSSGDWAKQVGATLKQSLQHRHYPFSRLVKQLDLPRQMGRAPVFQHMFTLNKEREAPFEQHLERLLSEQRGAAHELNLVIIDDEAGFLGRWRYSKALYRQETVERFRDQFIALVQAVLERPEVPFTELDWLPPAQQSLLQGEETPLPADAAWQAFTLQCAEKPQAIALEDSQGQLSYAELARAVVARGERMQGALSWLGERVALCLPRSRELVMHMLAAWQSGATYLALDPQWPESRLRDICLDAMPQLWIGVGQRPDWLPQQVHWLPVPSGQLFSDGPLHAALPADLPAYVVYTSGSSGRPKGVEVTQGNLIHYVTACLARLNLSADASLTSLASCATDLGHTALFGALLSGRRLRLLEEELAFDAEELATVLGRQPVDMLKIVPSHLNALLVASEPQRLLPRQCLVVGGEALAAELVARLRALDPQLRIVNHYGPSETTVGVLTHEVEGSPSVAGATLPLGRPLANVQVSVRAPDGALLPVGVSGELYVQGATVARGYLSATDQDRARFGEHGYRTGDRVRLNHQGQVLFLGRLDEQLKIRGYRVEPAEVAAQLRGLAQVEDVRVLNVPTPLSGNRLVAFLVAPRTALADIQSALQARLPDYMQPAQWHCLDALPLLANGKVDRQALLRQAEQLPQRTEASDNLPLNAVESALLDIWRSLLGNPDLGPDDNFFAHGGDSILGLQIIARARQQQISMTPKQLFAEPSVRALARVVDTPQRKREHCLLAIAREILDKPDLQADDNFFSVGGDSILSLQIIARAKQQGLQLKPKQIFEFPTVNGWAEQASDLASAAGQAQVDSAEPSAAFALTPIQAWFFDQQQNTPHYWNQSLLLAVHQPLEPVRLAQALATLLQRHSSLRLIFEPSGQGWQQRYQPLSADMAGKLLQVVEQPLDDALLQQWQQGWRLDEAPLIRWVYFTGSGHLLCTAHHLLVDAVSWQVLLEELESLYLDPQASLPAVSTRFDRWSEALQRHRLQPEVLAQREYWQAQLAEEGEVTRDVSLYGESRTLETKLSLEKTELLLGDCHGAYSTQVQDLLVAALAGVIGQWLGREQVTLEMESHGRSGWEQSPDLSRSVGWHTSRYPLAVPAAEDPEQSIIAAKEALRRVPEQGIGYGLLRLDPQHGLGAASLLTFNYLGRVDQWLGGSRLWRLAQPLCPAMRADDTRRTHLLDVTALVDQGQLHIEWRYAPQVHEQALIGALAQQFQQCIEALLEHCLAPEAGRATAADFADSGLSDDEFLGLLEQLQ
ncbi:non-ribosomal peptide synthase domain TIGR01720/amino acid adenylation domain-containing protein [Pseudomonas cuatrocienegasensis]|uniref:Non-ribosomal peptide synthase domain TIGR01720/amino acid adenylation domain-containing protein n=1 Tax=Pseudomonas cuatrocienegasensis TaxID=543360 RepID=A0ABY1BPF7_9PSED|nr:MULTISPECIES: non-ribosomal peptide synthetase [Pseudomonas]OEC33737.1 non-ribosomal peptide synthetase [Pseudomonas sp. 21C1]SER31313.1 non-ribosomal peptide synthase domain TIGR01720/amino acid adenylation domain-containing protein [Pseudomonas cuatrocienegasensis]